MSLSQCLKLNVNGLGFNYGLLGDLQEGEPCPGPPEKSHHMSTTESKLPLPDMTTVEICGLEC